MARLRLIVVALLLTAAYVAQAVFDSGSLQLLMPSWLVERAPWLFGMTLWLPEDLFTAAGWVLFASGLLIGLLLPAWSGSTSDSGRDLDRIRRSTGAAERLPALAGLLVAAGIGLILAMGNDEKIWMVVAWGGAIALVVYTAWRIQPYDTRQNSTRPGTDYMASAAILLPIIPVLLFTALLAGWHWITLPIRIDAITARFGVQMAGIDIPAAFHFFGPTPTGSPGLAFLPGRLLVWLMRDALSASHVLGMVAALLMVLGTWLTGRELFRRQPLIIDNQLILDDGRRAALLAAGLTGVSLATIHFGRLAPFLLATALGVLSCWLLLRGARLDDLRTTLVAGILAGGSLLMDRSGLAFLLIAFLWWIGLVLVGATVDSSRRRLQSLFLWWAVGAFAILAPTLGNWLHAPDAFRNYLQAIDLYGIAAPSSVDLWRNLTTTFSGLLWIGDASPVFGVPAHLLATIIVPLFLAGLALLLFSLDQLAGWCLLTWSVIVLACSAATNAYVPDWPTLLPLVPAAGLVIALLADRLRLLIVESFGAWTALASFYVAAGLLVAVAAANWIVYWEFTQLDGDAVSYLAHALHRSEAGTALVQLATDDASLIPAEDSVLRFAATDQAASMKNLTIAELGTIDAPSTRYFVLPPDTAALDSIRAKYPQGAVSLERDLHGNPRLWIYDVP